MTAAWRRFLVMFGVVCVSTLTLTVGFADEASARSFRVGQLPNGGSFGCGLCHEGGRSGAPRNAFGLQVEASLGSPIESANVTWSALTQLDADGDGYTNGEELGDPDGVWRIGDPPPPRNTADPSNADAFPLPCGNGELEPELGEACDRTQLDGETCQGLGFVSGQLLCGIDCNYDTVSCSLCGDGILNGREQCDGEDIGDALCSDLGFGRGALSCNDNCEFVTTQCSNCGNGVRDGGEQCDTDDLDGQTCLSRGYTGGALGCAESCDFDTSACTGSPSDVCGDGITVGDEVCDGDDFAGETCGSLGFAEGGALACRIDCTLDTSACSRCGNGTIDEGEDCDGMALGGATCGGLGLGEGDLACDGCRIVDDGCAEGGNNGGGNNADPNNNVDPNNNASSNSGNNGGNNDGNNGGNNAGNNGGNNGTAGEPPTPPTTTDEGCSSAGGPARLPLGLLGALVVLGVVVVTRPRR